MPLRRATGAFLVAMALLSLPLGSAFAQASAAVPLESRSYARIDALASAGLLPTLVRGQRPYSRREFARLATEARHGLSAAARNDAASNRLDDILRELEREFAGEIAAATPAADSPLEGRLDGVLLEVTQVDSPDRPIEHTVLGTVDAVVNPLLQGQGGRYYGGRTTIALEAAGHGTVLGKVVLAAHLRGEPDVGAIGRSLAGPGHVDVRALNVGLGFGNTVLRIGRQPLLLGPGMDGGLLASSNAPGLDMVHVGTDAPVLLPWVLRRLGPARASLFLGDLGKDQHFPHTRIAGWKVSILPAPSIEIGASLVSVQGGDGAPPARFAERVIDVFTIIDVVVFQDRDLLFSNKLAGLDLRVRGRGIEAYADLVVDDFDVRRVRSSLWEDGGLVAGISVPSIGPGGALRFDAEFQHTGLRYYEHGQFRSGYTSRGTIIGIPLGPRGDAGIARFRWDAAGRSVIEVTGAVERRSGDTWGVAAGTNDSNWTFFKAVDRPEETRLRAVAGWQFEPRRGGPRIEVDGGLERVLDHRFIAGSDRWNGLGRLGVTLGFQ